MDFYAQKYQNMPFNVQSKLFIYYAITIKCNWYEEEKTNLASKPITIKLWFVKIKTAIKIQKHENEKIYNRTRIGLHIVIILQYNIPNIIWHYTNMFTPSLTNSSTHSYSRPQTRTWRIILLLFIQFAASSIYIIRMRNNDRRECNNARYLCLILYIILL